MFRSLALFNYRIWFIGALVSNIGNWLQATALSWVVLTDLSGGNAAAMGITLALQFAPTLLLVGLTGWATDRVNRRFLLIVTQVAFAAIALTVGVLLLLDLMTLWMMYGLALAQGITVAFDRPARHTFVSDLVPRETVSNAVALNAASFNVARFIGPAIAGVLIIMIGGGWMFVLNAGTFLVLLVALLILRPQEFTPRVALAGQHRLADGLRYVWQRTDFLLLLLSTAVVGTFGMSFPIIASTMSLEFGRNADSFGLLVSIFAIGSIVGALLAAGRPKARLRFAVGGAFLFGVTTAASAAMPTYWTFLAICPLIGLATVTILTAANGYLQTNAEPALRGRVIALYQAVNTAGTALAAPAYGAVAAGLGPRAAILVAAFAGLGVSTIGGWWYLLLRRRQRRSAGSTASNAGDVVSANGRVPKGRGAAQ